MILPFSQDSYSRQRYLICLGAPVDEATFLRRAKVKANTYAGELLANLHDAIFRRSLELKRDYAEYYAVEYSTFGEYARKKFLIPQEIVNAVNPQLSRSRTIIYFHPKYCFLEGDYGREFLEKLLEPRRRK